MSIRLQIAVSLSTLLLAWLLFTDSAQWSLIQCIRSVVGSGRYDMSQREREIWYTWENKHTRTSLLSSDNIIPIPLYTIGEDLSGIDISKPILIKNASVENVLSIDDMLSPPLGELVIDYFRDAREHNTVPDAKGPLATVVRNILSGGVEKFGSQKIVRSNPNVIHRLVDQNIEWMRDVFGETRTRIWRALGVTVTSPVFMSRGSGTGGLASTTRTDMHCEPIANLVVQTEGRKTWTLVEPQYSHLLRPTVSPDGRAYFYSSLDPVDPNALSGVPRYEVITEKGDILYVPTWTWHRVEYLPNITAVSLSVFEFVPYSFFRNNPLYAITLIPNLVKEVVGLKLQ
mmetsp:Transcript_16735/g.25131  ORF Transcript_16735/g.25131 Transcript_16735/m.25131 type:complete len:343 (-) Transcript_16735:25-1053(-)